MSLLFAIGNGDFLFLKKKYIFVAVKMKM